MLTTMALNHSRLGHNTYPKGIKVSEEQMAALNLKGDRTHVAKRDWGVAG
jgi:hypothetical protein